MDDKHICTLTSSETLCLKRKTRLQRLWRYIQNLFLISEKNPRALLYFRSHKEIEAERKRQRQSKDRVIHPFSEFRIYFELVMIVVFLMHLLTTSWSMLREAVYTVEVEFSIHVHLIFAFLANVTDIVFTFRTGYEIDETREVVLDLKRIHKRYSRSFIFIADLIATIPLELIILHLPYTHAHHFRWLMILSVSRLFRLPTTVIYLRNAADLWKINPIVYKIIRYIIFSFLFLHWVGCLSVVIVSYFYIYNLGRTLENWIISAGINERSSYVKTYISAFFKATGQLMGITHGLYPNITYEDKLMTVLLFMVGYFLMGFILVLILQILTSQAVPEIVNLAFMNQLQVYMGRIKLPKSKQKTLVSYYQYLFSENSFFDDESLKMLSENLRTEIIMHSYRAVVKNVSIMAYFPQENIEALLNYLQKEIYMPGEYIMRAGSVGNCMYFIIKGTVAISTLYGVEVCHLHDGTYFGEIAMIIENNKRTVSALALEITEVCRLERDHFNLCVNHESEAYKRLLDQALTRQEHLEELNKIHLNRFHKEKN